VTLLLGVGINTYRFQEAITSETPDGLFYSFFDVVVIFDNNAQAQRFLANDQPKSRNPLRLGRG
jgi:hypothetical protein